MFLADATIINLSTLANLFFIHSALLAGRQYGFSCGYFFLLPDATAILNFSLNYQFVVPPPLTAWVVSYLYLNSRAACWVGEMVWSGTEFILVSSGINMDLCVCISMCTCVEENSLDKDTEMKHGAWSLNRQRICRKNLKGPFRPYDSQR